MTPAPRTKPASATLAPNNEFRITEIGAELLGAARAGREGVLSLAFWSNKLMDWSMRDEALKVQLFRFVDAFPTLRTPEQVHEHLVDYLAQPGVTPPPGLGLGMKAGGLLKGAMAKTVTAQITAMAKRFIAGTDAVDAADTLHDLWARGIGFSVDLLGEACVSDDEASVYRDRYIDLVTTLPAAVSTWADSDVLDRDHLGPIPRANVSIKISSLFARTDPIDFEGSIDGLVAALHPILEAARDHDVLINFDMEQFAFKDLTIELFRRCCEAIDFPAGIALQAYLRSGDEDARRLADWTRGCGRSITVRLVKGAYWDYETIHAEQMGWPVPVWSRKRDTDACFERMTRTLVDATPRATGEGGTKLSLGSHNVRSIAAGMAMVEAAGLPVQAIEIQVLHGMAEELAGPLVQRGWRLREYVPVGEMIPGMAYLVRRLLENTSNESWLRQGFREQVDQDTLLASPHRAVEDEDPGVARLAGAPERHALAPAVEGVGDGRPFFTEPGRNFADADQRTAFGRAVAAATVPAVEKVTDEQAATEAIDRAVAAFPAWRDEDPVQRSAVLGRAAEGLRRRRDELAGVIIRESGKTWLEADGDVCETIDFCEYYARMAPGLFEPRRLGRFVGELDHEFHQPRGVVVVISPWNFPMAICAGMTTAGLVTGNAVVVKPASQTPAIARLLCEILWEAGAPRDALQCLVGPGSTVGAALVRDPRTAVIAFTGSKSVGLDILSVAGAVADGQRHVKKVVCEMGGKNAIIVDASADLDEAVLGVRQSAFGYQGQKCSACSRAIVVDSAHDAFLERLVESTRSLVIGDPLDPGTDLGPVIDERAASEIRGFIDVGASEGRVALTVEPPAGLAERVGRPYVGPHILSGITVEHRLAHEEVFGPVLAVMRVADFDEALAVANSTDYKLTGGVFSRKPSHLERARREFRVGNLYLNRGITGALVGRQPFGGFGMSGIGSKAGGRSYLSQFVESRAVSENAMRRGFAPGL